MLEERTGLRWEEEVYSDTVTQCQTGPVRPVAANPCDEPPTYRNQYCAICNAEKTANLVCANPYDSRNYWDFCLSDAESCFNDSESYDNALNASSTEQSNMSTISPMEGSIEKRQNYDCLPPVQGPPFSSFTLFFDVRGNSGVLTSSIVSTTITISCSISQVFDPIHQVCRQTICRALYATHQGSCAIAMCIGGLIVLRESEFKLLDNDTLLFRNEAFEIVGYNDTLPIICSNFSQNGTIEQNMTVYSYPPIFSVLTYVGCSLSVVGCVAVLLTYSLFRELRTLPGKILMNLASTILATCLLIVIGIPIVSVTENDELCEATAILLHWLILSQFSWMSIMSFELLQTLYRASHLHAVKDKSKRHKIFVLYFLTGWGIPLVFTLITVIVSYTTDVIQYGRNGFCWIHHLSSLYAVFVAPVALSIVFNGIIFVITFSLLFKASRIQAKLKNQQNISYLRACLCVFSITGLTWISSFLAINVRDDWAWYTFIILTSTQGLVIAIAFIFTHKVSGLYKQLLLREFLPIASSKSSKKQRIQLSLLETKPARRNESAHVVSTTSALAQADAKPTVLAIHTRENASTDQVYVEMNNIHEP